MADFRQRTEKGKMEAYGTRAAGKPLSANMSKGQGHVDCILAVKQEVSAMQGPALKFSHITLQGTLRLLYIYIQMFYCW